MTNLEKFYRLALNIMNWPNNQTIRFDDGSIQIIIGPTQAKVYFIKEANGNLVIICTNSALSEFCFEGSPESIDKIIEWIYQNWESRARIRLLEGIDD